MSRFRRDRWSMNSTPFEMVHLVLEADREQAVDLFLVGLAVHVEPAGADPVGPHRPRHIARAPTGSPRCRGPPVRMPQDLGVDEDARVADDRLSDPRSSGSCRSITSRRMGTPTWTAARPMPGAAYIVSNMSATSVAQLVVERLRPACEICRRTRIGGLRRSGRMAMEANLVLSAQAVQAIGRRARKAWASVPSSR